MERHARDAERRSARVAYLVSRFPKLSETFILFELLEMRRQGVEVALYPLQREHATAVHPEARDLTDEAHFVPFLDGEVIRANLHFLLRSPGRYLGAGWALLAGTRGSARFLLGAIVFFPKIVAFARRMVRDGTTHVHAHFASHPAAAAYVIERLTGIPYSFTAHGSDLHRDRTMLAEKVSRASSVVTVSHFNRDIILEACGEACGDKVEVIRCGVDTRVFHPPAAPTGELEPGRPLRILCTGTLHEVKGQHHLIEACALLDRRGVKVACELIGDGPDRARLSDRVEALGLSGRVRMRGACTRLEVASLLRQADVVVAPSVPTRDGRREGIPVALMEAMATARAVVASRLTGIPELVAHEREGLLVAPGDVVALADALERLDGDPDLRQALGEAGRRRVASEFELAHCVSQLAAHFRLESEHSA